MTVDRGRCDWATFAPSVCSDCACRRALSDESPERSEHAGQCARVAPSDKRWNIDLNDLLEIAREPSARRTFVGVEQVGPPADDDAFHKVGNGQPVVPAWLGLTVEECGDRDIAGGVVGLEEAHWAHPERTDASRARMTVHVISRGRGAAE